MNLSQLFVRSELLGIIFCSVLSVCCSSVAVIVCAVAGRSIIMADDLSRRSKYIIGKIGAQSYCFGSTRFQIDLDRDLFDEYTSFDEYMECVAKSPVFKAFANCSKTLDCDGTVDQFLLESTVDSLTPFVKSSAAFDFCNKMVFETMILYKASKTDMFADVHPKRKRDFEPTDGLFLVVGKCAYLFRITQELSLFVNFPFYCHSILL